MSGPSPSSLEYALTVDAHPGKQRLDKWLAEHIPGISRTRIQQWIHHGGVLMNDEAVMPGTLVEPGAKIAIHAPAPTESAPPQPEEGGVEVVYEDEALVAVNKPSGLVVHPAPGHLGGTLVNRLLARYPEMASVGDAFRPGVVHRLDADTSGILLFARTPEALIALQRQFRDRRTEKTYAALCHGIPSPISQEINLPIGRHPVHRQKRAVNGEGARDARTQFRVERGLYGGRAALLEVHIETGRTHQIRVHLAHVGHPVLGDKLYGGKRQQLAGGAPVASRQMLHAARIQILHPTRRTPMEVTAPLAEDMKTYKSQIT